MARSIFNEVSQSNSNGGHTRTRIPTTDAGSSQSNDNEAKAWIAVAAAFAVLFVGVGYTNTYGVFQDYYQKHLFPDIPRDKIIVIGSVPASLYFILGAFTGRFADLAGYRISLMLGSTLMIGAMFAASVSKEYYQLFLSQGLMCGVVLALVYPPATTISRQYFDHRHGLANGIVVSGGALGGCVLPYAVRKMITAYGLSATFQILGYIAIGVLVPSIFFLRPKHTSTLPMGSRPPLIDLSLLKDSRFACLLMGCTIAMTGFLPRYFLLTTSAIVNGISPTYASWLLGMMNGLSILGRIGIGWVADRFGKIHALAASFLLCGLGHFAFWLPGVTVTADSTGTPTALFTLFAVYIGIFGSGFISLFAVVVSHLFGSDNLASKTGLLNTAIGMSVFAGPSAVYAIIEGGVSNRWTVGVLTSGLFLFVGGVVLSAAGLAMRGQEKTKHEVI